MFLDDELKQIYLDSIDKRTIGETVEKIITACTNRLHQPEDVSKDQWLSQYPTLLKQVDNSFVRFMKECNPPFMNQYTFKEYIYKASARNMLEDQIIRFFKILNWEIKPEWKIK